MNTSSKKLSLQRETLRTITADSLEGVLGGNLGGGIAGVAVGSARVHDTVYRPGKPQGYNDTVYHGH